MDFSALRERIDSIPPEIVAQVRVDVLRKGCPFWADHVLQLLCPGGGLTAENVPIRTVVYRTEAEAEAILERKGRPQGSHLSPLMHDVVKHLMKHSDLYHKLSAARREVLEARPEHTSAGAFLVEKASKSIKKTTVDAAGVPVVQELPMLRMITDARRGNARCADEPSFPLFTLEALLQTVSNVSDHVQSVPGVPRKWYAVNVDFRHWFHQLPLPGDLHHLFMLRAPDDCLVYVPRAVPMGWLLAPLIGQAAMWSIVLGGDDVTPGITKRVDAMPAWLPFEDAPGGIFGLIDNICIITTSEKRAKQWARRLARRAQAVHAVFKDLPYTTDPELPPGAATAASPTYQWPVVIVVEPPASPLAAGESPPAAFTFSGIRFDFNGWRTAERNRSIDPTSPTSLTRRQISALLGEVLWDLRVRQVPPHLYADVLAVYAMVAPALVADWDEQVRLSPVDDQTLRRRVAEARLHLRRERLPAWSAHGPIAFYAVDACQDAQRSKIAFVLLTQDEQRNPDQQPCAVRTLEKGQKLVWGQTTHQQEYIGTAELEAIVVAVEHGRRNAIETGTPRPVLYMIATDSQVARGWVERDYSARADARQLLARLAAAREGARIACHYVKSADNVADEPSRTTLPDNDMGAIKPEELEATGKLLNAAVASTIQYVLWTGRVAARRERAEEQNVQKAE